MSNETTNVVGYFNPNDYPMQIVVAEHNLTLHLNPKQWIVGRSGAIVNDPILDKYVGKGRLSRASDKAKTVPLVRLEPLNKATPTGQVPANYQHPVFAATGFVRDANNQMQPVAMTPTAPQPTVPPPVSYNPVKAMTVEQARKLRLIKPTRQVDEDAGVPDTAGAPLPGDKLPPIKYAVDTTKEALPATVIAAPMTAEQAALVETMKTAQTLDPEAPDFADKAVRIAAANPTAQPAAVAPPPPPSSTGLFDKLTKPFQRATIPPPLPTNPEPTVMTAAELPDPVLGQPPTPAPAAPALVVEDDLGHVAEAPKAPVETPKTAPVETPKCPLCPEQVFSAPGYLVRHINRKHPDRAEALLRQVGLV